jgi:hypothetical protein
VAGGGTAGLTKGIMNVFRGTSTIFSGGLTNPLFSALELAAAVLLSVLAITVPAIAITVVIGTIGFAVYRIRTFFVKFSNQQTHVQQ